MNHNDGNMCYAREIVLFDNIIATLNETAKQSHMLLQPSSGGVSDKEGGNFEQMRRMDQKLIAIQRANWEADQQSDGFSSDLTHQPLSSARLPPDRAGDCSSQISIQEL
jgi:hypothetical protein